MGLWRVSGTHLLYKSVRSAGEIFLNTLPQPGIGFGPRRAQTARYIHSLTKLSWPGPWRRQTVRYIHSPTKLYHDWFAGLQKSCQQWCWEDKRVLINLCDTYGRAQCRGDHIAGSQGNHSGMCTRYPRSCTQQGMGWKHISLKHTCIGSARGLMICDLRAASRGFESQKSQRRWQEEHPTLIHSWAPTKSPGNKPNDPVQGLIMWR